MTKVSASLLKIKINSMTLSDDFWTFIRTHRHDDVCRLRLKYSSANDELLDFAITQIEARQKVGSKLPLWQGNEFLLFPSALSVEQSSSEETAQYKSQIINGLYPTVCDLTGGLGIDSYYFSKNAERVTYIERFSAYCDAARHNFCQLNSPNITIIQNDCREYLRQNHPHHSLYYIDPARRGDGNRRVYNLADCEPDIAEILPIVQAEGADLLVKASPMLDITQTLREYPSISNVYIVSVKNECKELLFRVKPQTFEGMPSSIECVNIVNDTIQYFTFTILEENSAIPSFVTEDIGKYLYEPNSSLMKAGAYRIISSKYDMDKLGVNTHLYTSDAYIEAFPGRVFKVLEMTSYSKQELKNCARKYPCANISCRNFPLSVDEIRKQSKIKDGGDIYIFMTTIGSKKSIIVCRK